MKNINNQIKKVVAITGIMIGGFALSVLAQSTFTEPTQQPPGGNIAAPVNVGDNFQIKSGKLALGTLKTYSQESNRPFLDVSGIGMFDALGVVQDLVVGEKISAKNLQISDGSPVAGKILTAIDNSGNMAWKTLSENPGSSIKVTTPKTLTSSGSATQSVELLGAGQTAVMCFLQGLETTNTSGSTPSSCWVEGSTLKARTGANDTVKCSAACLIN